MSGRTRIVTFQNRERDKQKQNARKVFRKYCQGALGTREFRVLDTERPFFAAVGSNLLTGKMDLVSELPEAGFTITEFKYHRNPLLDEYAEYQLRHYRLGYPRQTPVLRVHYLKDGEHKDFQSPHPDEIRDDLDRSFRAIRKREFDATPSATKCRICPVRLICTERHPSATV